MSHRVTAVLVAAPVLALGVAASASSSPDQRSARTAASRATVSMSDFRFAPKRLTARAGTLRVTARNRGTSPHEFVLIRTSKAPGRLKQKGRAASEAGAVGEIPEQRPGRRATKTFRVRRGTYVFICNVPGHYKAGMYGRLTVR